MALRIKIDDGGTNAGHRIVLEPRRHTWQCSNGHDNKPNHSRCMTLGCNERRDDRRRP